MTSLIAKTVNGRKYYSLVESYREDGKPKHRIVKYIGVWERVVRLLESGSLTLEDVRLKQIRDYGAPLAVQWICEQLGIEETITRYSDKTPGIGLTVGRAIEIIVMNRVLDPKSKYLIPDWFKSTVLPDHIGMQDDAENEKVLASSDLYRSLDYLDEKIIENIERDLAQRAIEWLNIKPTSLYYDITSLYFEGSKCTLALFGYSRDHRPDRKQVVVGLVVTRGEAIPVAHWTYPGNTADKTTTVKALGAISERFPKLDIKVVMDRGMISDNVLEELDKANREYLVGLNASQKRIGELIDSSNGTPVFHLTVREKTYDVWELSCEENGRTKKILLVKSSVKAELDNTSIDKDLEKARKRIDEFDDLISRHNYKDDTLLKKAEKVKNAVKRYHDHVTEIVDGPPQHRFPRSESKISQAKRCAGFYALLSSDPALAAEEAIEMYIDKNDVEASFRTIKGDLEIRPIHHHLEHRVRAHVFTCVLAYLVLRVMNRYLRKKRSKHSAQSALDVLEGVKIGTLSHNERTVEKIVDLTKQQEKVMNLFEVPII